MTILVYNVIWQAILVVLCSFIILGYRDIVIRLSMVFLILGYALSCIPYFYLDFYHTKITLFIIKIGIAILIGKLALGAGAAKYPYLSLIKAKKPPEEKK